MSALEAAKGAAHREDGVQDGHVVGLRLQQLPADLLALRHAAQVHTGGDPVLLTLPQGVRHWNRQGTIRHFPHQ